jgi:hypothetical protein
MMIDKCYYSVTRFWHCGNRTARVIAAYPALSGCQKVANIPAVLPFVDWQIAGNHAVAHRSPSYQAYKTPKYKMNIVGPKTVIGTII